MQEELPKFHLGPALDLGAAIGSLALTLALWDTNRLAAFGLLAVALFFLVEMALDIAAAMDKR